MNQKKGFISLLLISTVIGALTWLATQNVDSVSGDVKAPGNETIATEVDQEPSHIGKQKDTWSARNKSHETTSLHDSQLELKDLMRSVLDQNRHPDQRRKDLSVLVEKGTIALPLLDAIANHKVPPFPTAKDPHSQVHMQKSFEIGLRITAIEAIDQLGATGADVTKILQRVQATHEENQLVLLASIALEGIAEGRPGKVTRFINKVFDEALGENK